MQERQEGAFGAIWRLCLSEDEGERTSKKRNEIKARQERRVRGTSSTKGSRPRVSNERGGGEYGEAACGSNGMRKRSGSGRHQS
ncbi:MAG: hypothetical protein M1840_007003 [Geoglossum simile]|nr:MAG: hypothetical protein M1840_007003 [Geoglossum simile]